MGGHPTLNGQPEGIDPGLDSMPQSHAVLSLGCDPRGEPKWIFECSLISPQSGKQNGAIEQ